MHPLLSVDTRRLVIGHRGNAAFAPENTLESFAQAVAAGVDAIEFDVRLTRDGRVVVHHDPTVDRTTAGRGAIQSLRLGEVSALDAGARFTRDGVTFPYRQRGVRVPTLEEVIERFPSTPLLIEIKTPAAAAPTREVVERYGAASRTVVDAFDAACLTPFRDSAVAVGSSRNDVAWLMARVLSRVPVRRVPFRVMCVPTRYSGLSLPVERFVRVLEPLGVPVHVWTVNDPAEADGLWARGVRGIISDDPGAMLAVRRRNDPSPVAMK